MNFRSSFSAFLLLLSVLSISYFLSCKKDLAENEYNTQFEQGFKSFNWSLAEEDFFSLNSSLDRVDQRNARKFRYNPTLVEAFNQIAEENESNHFVDALAQSGGLAQWSRSIVFPNANTQEKVVLIPLIQRNKSDVNGLIVLYKKPGEFNNKFIINGISRSDLLDTLSGNDHQKAFLSDWMQRLDKSIFDHQDSKLADAHCAYKRRSRGLNGPGGGPDPVEPCYWRLVEICSDLNTQKSYISGVSILPPHLDHDGDGILNQDDEDWKKFSLEKNITQEQFTRIVKQWWDEKVESDEDLAGKEYEDYWDEIDWANGESWEDFIDKLDDIWDDFIQWLDGIDIHIDFDWLDRLFDPIQCPFDDPLNGGVQDREIRCSNVYVKICPTGSNWWDDIVETNPLCGTCMICNNMRLSQFIAKLDHYISIGYLTVEQKIIATEDPDYGRLLCKLIDLDDAVGLSKIQFQWLERNGDENYIDAVRHIEVNQELYDEVTIVPQQGNIVSVSSNRGICDGMFDFRFTSNNQIRRGSGLYNLKVTMPIDQVGTLNVFSWPVIYFESDDVGGNCNESLEIKAANAINSAITMTNTRRIAGTLYKKAPNESIQESMRNTYFLELNRAFYVEVNECAPHHSALGTKVQLLSANTLEPLILSGIIFRNFVNEFNQRCP